MASLGLPRRAVSVLYGLLLAWCWLPCLCRGASVTDQYVPYCSSYTDPPPSGWLPWSKASSWPGGQVPGVGSNTGADAIIPCDTGILLDVNVTLGTLDVRGSFRVAGQGPYQVFANFIVNQGRILIGAANSPYTGKVYFNITGSTQEYLVTRDPKDPTKTQGSPRSAGTRAVITLGGTWNVNGLYGNQQGWTKLAKNANKGDTNITVKSVLSAWPVGGEIAIASTDFDYKQAERLRITKVTVSGTNTILGLSQPLKWTHWGNPIPTGVTGVNMDQAAEVLLLTRSIVIQGHPNPVDPLIGGHFIIYQTPATQSIIGVELNNMGQQGNLARYPMHFHLAQDVRGSLIRGCVVHDSNQRCYVVHGTWNAQLIGNGAFNTKGHCYIVEDGIETNNTFQGNLGFTTEPPQRVIDASGEAFPPVISDNAPSTFWISNGNNTWMNNVAAGSYDSGFWFEMQGTVSGPSILFPGASMVYPKYIPLKSFVGNVAHSNGRAGLRTYPSGYRPKVKGGVSSDQATAGPNAAPQTIYFNNFKAYKNDFIGLFIHETDALVVDGAQVADNGLVGLEINRAQDITIQNSIFLGETENVGNPTTCGVSQSGCRPVLTPSNPNAFKLQTTCSFPTSNDPAVARSYHPELNSNGDLFGILMDADDFPSHGQQGAPCRFYNLTFGKFYSFCRTAAAGITANGDESAFWSTAHSSRNVKLVDGSAPLWFTRPNGGHLGFEPSGGSAGAMSYYYTLRDEDGSLVGGKGGYAVTSTAGSGLMPLGANCSSRANWNGFACPGLCYRSIMIEADGNFTLNRSSDGASLPTQGTNIFNLPANTLYRLTFLSGEAPPSFTISYLDKNLGCQDPVVIQIVQPNSNAYWTVYPASNVVWQTCQGVTQPFDYVTQTQYLCTASGSNMLQVTMGASYTSQVKILQTAGSPPCTLQQCGIFQPKSLWWYNDTGAKPSSFLSLVSKGQEWKVGRGLFGFGGVGENTTISNPSANSLAYYFRQNFNLKFAGCIDSLIFGYIADDGMVVYLNGAEVFRTNLPSGKILQTTPATMDVNPKASWSQYTVKVDSLWLQSGQNVIQVELHTASATSFSARFDMWLAAIGKNCPSSQFFNPQGRAKLFRSAV